jgi:cyclopropane-fatty-acyl-phospholipid synthase
MRHLTAKLLLDPGRRVLDIGSGWGGFGCYLAENCGAQVDGVTLSVEQFEYSCARARDVHALASSGFFSRIIATSI